MAALYTFRLDDIAPNMRWDNYEWLKACFDRYGVRPLIGVIPDNRDPALLAFPISKSDFWEEVRNRQSCGWTNAQHGYQHVYQTTSGGRLGLGTQSEFSGLPYDVQLRKLRQGRDILRREKIDCDTFMAPSHSFDDLTLRALSELGFRQISDGHTLFPIQLGSLVHVPQLLATPRWMPFGIHTWCLHLNEMDSQQLDQVDRFIKRFRSRIISFDTASHLCRNDALNRSSGVLVDRLLRTARAARKLTLRPA